MTSVTLKSAYGRFAPGLDICLHSYEKLMIYIWSTRKCRHFEAVYSFFSFNLALHLYLFLWKNWDSKYLSVKQRKKVTNIRRTIFFGWHQPVLTVPGRRNWPVQWKVDRAGTSSSCTTCFRLGRCYSTILFLILHISCLKSGRRGSFCFLFLVQRPEI